MTRRKFLGTTLAGGATLIAGGSTMIFAANSLAVTEPGTSSVFRLGGDLPVNRLGFGAMRITGEGIWGWPADRGNTLKVLRRVVELGVNLIDTADAYGPETSELLIAEALHPYPKDLVIATKGGLTRPGPGQWGAERPPGIPHPMCGEESKTTPTRANRFVSTASHRSESADGRIARST